MKTKFAPGIFLAFIAAFLWSTGGIGIKALSLNGVQIACFRALFSSLAFLPFFRLSKLKWNRLLIGFIISFTWMTTSFVVSTKLTTAANAIALQYTSVFWVFLFDELLVKRTLQKEKILPLVIVLIGIWFYMSEPNTGTNVLGNIIGLSSGMAFGLVAIFLRRLSLPDGKSLICLTNGIVFVILFMATGFEIPITENVVFELSVLIYLGAVQIALSYAIFNKALHTITSLTGSFVALIEPVLNPIWVYLLLKEVPTFNGFMGWICLMTSVVIYLLTLNTKNSDKSSTHY